MTSNKPIRWGILAAGSIAGPFAKALKECEGSVLHAVASRDPERARTFAAEHGAARAYGNYDAMLADPEVDVVYVATIHPCHFEWIVKSVQAGKHVLCEKPLTMNLREAKQAQKIAKEKRRLLREAFMYRHHPNTQKVVDWVTSGAIGKVRMIEASFCFNFGVDPSHRVQDRALGGGGILDLGCYPLSFARLVAGRAHDRLFAEPIELKAVGHIDQRTKTDVWTTAALRFEGDILAKLTCAVRFDGDNRAVIYGDSGRITVENPWFAHGAIEIRREGEAKPETVESCAGHDLYSYEIDSFVGEMRGRPLGATEVGMRYDDTLGNMRALDWWRSEIGMGYEADVLR